MVEKSVLSLVVLSISVVQWNMFLLTYTIVNFFGLAMMKKLQYTVKNQQRL